MDDLPIVAKRLRKAREKAGISQKQLGILAGIDEFSSSARVNQYERGKHAPDYLTLEHFARVLKVDVTFFYARDENTARFLEIWGGLSPEARASLTEEATAMLGESRGCGR